MGLNNIGMDYDALLNDSSELDKKIVSYNDNCSEFFKIVDDMRSYWEGSSADAAINATLNYKPEFIDLGNTLRGYPTTLKTAIDTHRKIEEEIVGKAGRV